MLKFRKQTSIPHLPYPYYFFTVLGLTLTGLLISFYLLFSHYRVYTDIGYRSFCALSRSINCDTVSQSPYSILLELPVPLWGVFGYAFLLLLIFLSLNKYAVSNRFWSIILAIALIYSLMSIFFAYLSTFHIRSYCIMCIATYAVNFLILFYAWLIRRRFDSDSFFSALTKDVDYILKWRKKAFYFFSPFLISVILIWVFVPSYWQIPPPPLSKDLPVGLTHEGHPWIGAPQPVLTITEFTDYQCFQCKKMHHYLRTLVQENPEKIRLVHRHFPMDRRFNPLLKTPFHTAAGEMAILAIYAATQDKFWPVNDLLFEIARQKRDFNTREIGEKTGLDYRGLSRARKDPAILLRLQKDIIDGIKLGIQGTPAFLIEGKVYTGQIPPEVIEKALK